MKDKLPELMVELLVYVSISSVLVSGLYYVDLLVR